MGANIGLGTNFEHSTSFRSHKPDSASSPKITSNPLLSTICVMLNADALSPGNYSRFLCSEP
jgi:hypothetical protein